MKNLKIDILASSGSPIGVTEKTLSGGGSRVGCGGAESGILTLCRLWHEAGHDVTFYNDGNDGDSVFKHAPQSSFSPLVDRAVVICFRVPDGRIQHSKGKKIFYSNDQFTSGSFEAFAKLVDTVVCISPFHAEYFKVHYGIYKTEVIDIPIRTWEYENVPKVKKSCMFNSVPDRGLIFLPSIWKHIVERVPDASLTITGDWSLWSGNDYTNEVAQYRRAFAGMKNVTYLSAVRRSELIKIQSQTEYFLYPHVSENPELFCISLAEAQVAGAVPITSRVGAIETTNRFGYKIDGHPQDQEFKRNFIDKTVSLMQNNLIDISDKAKLEFGSERILERWNEIFSS